MWRKIPENHNRSPWNIQKPVNYYVKILKLERDVSPKLGGGDTCHLSRTQNSNHLNQPD